MSGQWVGGFFFEWFETGRDDWAGRTGRWAEQRSLPVSYFRRRFESELMTDWTSCLSAAPPAQNNNHKDNNVQTSGEFRVQHSVRETRRLQFSAFQFKVYRAMLTSRLTSQGAPRRRRRRSCTRRRRGWCTRERRRGRRAWRGSPRGSSSTCRRRRCLPSSRARVSEQGQGE